MGLKRQSAKRAREHRERIAWLRRTDSDRLPCAWPHGCGTPATDAHELTSRARGGSITDPDNVVPLCRPHHDWVTTHPAEAAALGLARSAAPCTKRIGSDTLPNVPRKPITIRVSDAADQYVEDEAGRAKVPRALVLRAMLSVASQHTAEVRAKIESMSE